jgi:hypothetical protein
MDLSLSGWTYRAPTGEEMMAGLDEFLSAAALERCAEHPDMAKAILNQ